MPMLESTARRWSSDVATAVVAEGRAAAPTRFDEDASRALASGVSQKELDRTPRLYVQNIRFFGSLGLVLLATDGGAAEPGLPDEPPEPMVDAAPPFRLGEPSAWSGGL